MATSSLFNQPNRAASYWADTQQPIKPAPVPTLGTAPFGATAPLTIDIPGRTGTTPQFSLLNQTKNPLLGAGQLSYLNKLGETSTANALDLGDFTKRLGDLKTGSMGSLNQELSNIGDVYSGKVSNDLAEIRNRYAQGARMATDNAIAAGNAARKSQAIGSGFGGSSYFGRQAAALQNDAGAKLAADLADREANDYRYTQGLKGSLYGARDRLGNTYAGNALLGTQARTGLLNSELGQMGQLGQMDLANNFYGLSDGQGNAPIFPGQFVQPGSNYIPMGGSQNAGDYFRNTGGGGPRYNPNAPQVQAPRQGSVPRGYYQNQPNNGAFTEQDMANMGYGALNPVAPGGGGELGRLRSFYDSPGTFAPNFLTNEQAYNVSNLGNPYAGSYSGSEEQYYNSQPEAWE